MRAVLTRAGIVCILIAGCGASGAGVETGTGGEIGGVGGSAGNGDPTTSAGGTTAGVGGGGTPGLGGTAGVATTSSGGNGSGGNSAGGTGIGGAGTGGSGTGTGGITAPGGAAGATSAVPPTAAVIPLYTAPSDKSWAAVTAAKTAHPKVPVYAVINPANGPGPAADAGYAAGIGKLQLAGVTVVGYVPTGYGARSVAAIEADIDHWKSFYPAIQGIFFDEMSNRLGDELIYKTVSQYTKSKGMTFTVGNPGIDTKPTFVGTTDVVMIYEGSGFPATTMLSGWHTGYPRTSFGLFAYGVATPNHALIKQARPYVGYIYVNSDVLPNPWDSVPSYLSDLLADLESP
jgi:hypothetical protein